MVWNTCAAMYLVHRLTGRLVELLQRATRASSWAAVVPSTETCHVFHVFVQRRSSVACLATPRHFHLSTRSSSSGSDRHPVVSNQDAAAAAINEELREVYRSILSQFRGVGYCFAYGSGVFPQTTSSPSISDAEFRKVHPNPPRPLVQAQGGSPKMVDLIFGVLHTEHFHSLNIKDHPEHYSFLGSMGAQYVAAAQDRWGAGVYFHPYVTVNGIQIKYGVTSLANLVRDLSTWDTLYLAGRLQKPVRIVRDHPQVRFANQQNLMAAVRTAQLLLPQTFDEMQLYRTIAGLSYLGDPRMALPTESPTKVSDIVTNNIVHFRRLYAPIIANLPAIWFCDEHGNHQHNQYQRKHQQYHENHNNPPSEAAFIGDPAWLADKTANYSLQQDMEPNRRADIVQRLPPAFRNRLYFRYQRALGIPPDAFDGMTKTTTTTPVRKRVATTTEFDMRVVAQGEEELQRAVRAVVGQTVKWPATTQSMKGLLSAGVLRSVRYFGEKVGKWSAGRMKK